MNYTLDDAIEYGNQIKLKSNAIIETGNTYGALTVIAPVRFREERKILWHCKCSCGNDCFFNGSELRAGKRTSCGNKCNNLIEEKPGTIYGYLEILKRDETPAQNFPDKCIHWMCKCQLCGTIKSISGRNLRAGITKSCGCLESYGEQLIAQALQELKIKYIKEYTFDNLRSEKGNLYRFDFAIFNEKNKLQFIIEFNGPQHFKDTMPKWQNLEKRQEADEIKYQYCIEHHIPQLNFNNYGNHQLKNVYEEILKEIKDFYERTKEDLWYVTVLDYDFGNL